MLNPKPKFNFLKTKTEAEKNRKTFRFRFCFCKITSNLKPKLYRFDLPEVHNYKFRSD